MKKNSTSKNAIKKAAKKPTSSGNAGNTGNVGKGGPPGSSGSSGSAKKR